MELRKDYILDRWVIISEKRAKRPDEFKQKKEPVQAGKCFFCPGNETDTPPEISRIEKDGKWAVRVFPNKFNFAERVGDPSIKTADRYFTYSNPYGEHEVIVETNDHSKQLCDLPPAEIKDVLHTYSDRIKELSARNTYVNVFKNSGTDAGTSLSHSHSQVAALNIVPPQIRDEADLGSKDGKCLYCDIISIEKRSFRRVYENDSFVSFCPYASRFNFEVWLFPKRHITSITEMVEKEFDDLSDMMKKLLVKLKELEADYNYCLHYAPPGKNLHFHIELMPRLAKWAGMELSTGIIINTVSPESAAKFYRGEQ
jgi:UDPglucose--hexose-1-phosphate uridylyltransferase